MDFTKYVVVTTKDGFMTQKPPHKVLESDEAYFLGHSKACNDFIHGIKPPKFQKNIKTFDKVK